MGISTYMIFNREEKLNSTILISHIIHVATVGLLERSMDLSFLYMDELLTILILIYPQNPLRLEQLFQQLNNFCYRHP